jgi:hypothetical protein
MRGGKQGLFAGDLTRVSSQFQHREPDGIGACIAEAELPGSKTTADAKAIVDNTAAMIAATKLADNIDDAAILAMHEALMRDVDPKSAGRWRHEQVWIGGAPTVRGKPCSRRRTTAASWQPSTTCSASRSATTSPRYRRSRWHTRSSRRSTPAPMGMAARAGH